ncbi:hypothetical protein SteCoe_34316 [Stentor coeruleus]|uniref:Uncharacterized protein n=1 Tax=Stentor coeruleus TaxID=5963 RepID=A0A1R2AUS9_9CILI|nr:hypothetical protein SteCoe_34316 [Stentor coeruleus]
MDTNLKKLNNLHVSNPSIGQFSAGSMNLAESLYSSIASSSISLPSNGSSADSIDVQSIKSKNKQLFEVLSARLTTFLYFSENMLGQPYDFLKSSLAELSQIKDTISTLEEQRFSLNSEEKLGVEALLRQINELHSLYSYELKKLERSKDELLSVEEEESELHSKLKTIESEMCRLMTEQERVHITCQCIIS